MKTVGKQLQEARQAKNWTPELAARETKIKVERLRDLEADDYSHFTSPTYARGFVRTYARALGLDEYKILRQLDNKLPDDDSSNIVTDTGVAYLPETAMPPRAAHRDYTGLYIVMGLGAVVALVSAFVIFEAYRVGELSRYFGQGTETVTTPTGSTNSVATETPRALPIDSNTPPPVVETPPPTTNAPAQVTDTTSSPRALPVDAAALAAATNSPPTAPTIAEVPTQAPRALPVDLDTTNAAPVEKVPPRAQPVNPSELAATDGLGSTSANTAPSTVVPPDPAPSLTDHNSNSGPVMAPSSPAMPPSSTPNPPTPDMTPTTPDSDQRLVLTASQDSFVRVTSLDEPDADQPLYAAVLHRGQSVGFKGRKFSINVGVPSAVDIQLDGVNYGPHSDRRAPETFNVESHLP
jgi:cytoskeleton protein RodZ